MVDGESARRSVVESWISKARANLRAAETLLGGGELEGEHRPPTARAEAEEAVARARDAVAAIHERVLSRD